MTSSSIAFVPGARVVRARRAEGPLSGLTFSIKDVFDVRGHCPSAGHPDYARLRKPAEHDAPVVSQLLEAGADLVGVTILDEFAFSLTGQNPHYGTPENPRASARLCGGSSCGSAAAVAACLSDFALGTDTGGSIRVPASFCGLFGFRPSHGRISAEGVVPLAPSFDTVGFLARDAHTFEQVSGVLLGTSAAPIGRVLIADDALALCDAGVAEVLSELVSRIASTLSLSQQHIKLAPAGFAPLRTAFRRLQGREVWATHGAWLETHKPTLSPPIAERFGQARELFESGEGAREDREVVSELCGRLQELLGPSDLLFLPPAPGVAPRIDDSEKSLADFRARTLELTSFASLTGAPQLVIPARELEGAPLGFSFAALPGQDAWLAGLTATLDRALRH